MSRAGNLANNRTDFSNDGFEEVDRILSGGAEEASPKQMLGEMKESLVDDFIYSEVLTKVIERGDTENIIESLERVLGNPDDEDMVRAIKEGGRRGNGELYERLVDFAIKAENEGKDVAYEDSIFADERDISDASGIDYVLRGGKRLRPFMTLLTEYALTGETGYLGAMTGAAQEVVHASSLQHDDDMDNDPLRRDKLSSERINRALYGDSGWKQSVLDGNRVEAWGNRAILSIVEDLENEGIPKSAADRFINMQDELNTGQKTDIEMEDQDVSETELEDYQAMIAGKTGALFEAGIMMMAETYLDDEEFEDAEEHFKQYSSAFNMLFQSGDDAIEVFRPDNSGKTVTDVKNRKLTMPAIVTKDYLRDENPEYAQVFESIFDGAYDEVTSEMRDAAEAMHQEAGTREDAEIVYDGSAGPDLMIPDDAEAGGDWEEDWLTHAIRSYGRVASEETAQEYLDEAREALDSLEDDGYINSSSRDIYEMFAEFVWSRDH